MRPGDRGVVGPDSPGAPRPGDATGHPISARIADDLVAALPQLSREITRTITEADPYWGRGPIGADEIAAAVERILGHDLSWLGGRAHDTTSHWPSGDGRAAEPGSDGDVHDLGARWASAGVPLATIMQAHRVAMRHTWRTICDRALRHDARVELLADVGSGLMLAQERRAQSLVAGWNSESTAMALRHETERAALVEALLDGVPLLHHTLWEIADLLGVPPTGWYVVVLAHCRRAGQVALHDVQRRLQAASFQSAWRLSADTQTGVVGLRSRADVARLVPVLRTVTTGAPVGVSPSYGSLSDTAQFRRLATVAARAAAREGAESRVLTFDQVPLLMSAVASPDVNLRIADDVLDGLRDLEPHRRELLLDTLEAWMDNDGSTSAAAHQLFVHRNTVHQRIRRLEQLTGRSLTSPRQAAELCLALLTVRSLPPAGRSDDDLPL